MMLSELEELEEIIDELIFEDEPNIFNDEFIFKTFCSDFKIGLTKSHNFTITFELILYLKGFCFSFGFLLYNNSICLLNVNK